MASELSKFIEDELKSQGIHDDEEQRLLSNLRVKPLSVEQPLQASGWSSRKKILVFGGIALIAALIAILLFTQFGGGARTTRDLARVEDENSSPIPSKSPSKPNKKEADTDDDYDEYDKKPDPKEEEKEKEKASKDDDDDDDDDDEEEEKSEAREKIQEEADYDYDYDYEPQAPTPEKDGSNDSSGASSEKGSKDDYDYSEDYIENEEKSGNGRTLKTDFKFKSSRSMSRKLRAAIAA